MSNRHVGVRIARRLQASEHAVDRALIEVSALIQAMIEARKEAGFAADVGQPALRHMVHGLAQLTEARSALVEGHEVLSAVAARQGLAWRFEGPLEEKTRPKAFTAVEAAA